MARGRASCPPANFTAREQTGRVENTFVKRRADAPAGLFAAEAAGLAWLRVPGGACVVRVIAHDETSITLERVRTVAPSQPAAEAFGAALAVTHDAGAPGFGCPPQGFMGQNFIADLPMPTITPNTPDTSWGHFYAEQRLLPYARMGASTLGADGVRVIGKLADRLESGAFDDGAPPARLHGDLWAGNVLFGEQGVMLIDPSAHGGHRLTDLAMLALFGAPHLSAILAAYEEASVWLPDDWRALIGLHQVYPLLVHTVLFGGGYAHQAVATARAFL